MRRLAFWSLFLVGLAWGVPLRAADYFLTIGGGYSPAGNQVSLEKNVRYFQRVLEQFYPKGVDHTILFADGDDPGRDLQFRPRETGMTEAREAIAHIFGQTRHLYDHYRDHELEGVRGPSAKSELESWVGRMKDKLQPGDRVVIYVTAHGGRAPNRKTPYNTRLYLWNNQSITMRDFTAQLDRLPESVPVAVVMVQCYSGGFSHVIYQGGDASKGVAPHLRCGFFATVHTRGAAGCTPEINEENYHEYSTYFWAAVSGTTRTGKPVSGADLDGDGRVSFSEAHAYALSQSTTIDISVKTSDVLLRRYSLLGAPGDATLFSVETLWEELSAGASAEERAVAESLSRQLGLKGSDRGRSAQALAKKLEKEKADLGKKVGRLVREQRSLAGALKKKLLQHWPELGNPWHPQVAVILDDDSKAVMKVLKEDSRYGKYLKALKKFRALSEQRSALEKRWVKCQRLIRSLENMALEHNLPIVATTEEQQQVARLMELEHQTLGPGNGTGQTATLANNPQ